MNGYGLYVQDLMSGFYSCSMEEMKNLINGLRRKQSAFSLRSVASFAPSVNTKEAMKQLCKHLYKAGVTGDTIRGREAQAVTLFQDQNLPPVDNQEVPQTTVLEEQQKGKGRSQTLGSVRHHLEGSLCRCCVWLLQ